MSDSHFSYNNEICFYPKTTRMEPENFENTNTPQYY